MTKDDLKTAISELRSELKTDISELRGDIAKLEAGNAVLQEQIKSIRTEIRVVLAIVLALGAPVFLRLFGLI